LPAASLSVPGEDVLMIVSGLIAAPSIAMPMYNVVALAPVAHRQPIANALTALDNRNRFIVISPHKPMLATF
jgi:hypothetical protein